MNRRRGHAGLFLPRQPIRLATIFGIRRAAARRSLLLRRLLLIYRIRRQSPAQPAHARPLMLSIVHRHFVRSDTHVARINRQRYRQSTAFIQNRIVRFRPVRNLVSRLVRLSRKKIESRITFNYRYEGARRYRNRYSLRAHFDSPPGTKPAKEIPISTHTIIRDFARRTARHSERLTRLLMTRTRAEREIRARSITIRLGHDRLPQHRDQSTIRITDVATARGPTPRGRSLRAGGARSRSAGMLPTVRHLFEHALQQPARRQRIVQLQSEKRLNRIESRIELERRVLPTEIHYREPPQTAIPRAAMPAQATAPTPQLDIERITENVMRSISKKMKVERERRGQF